MHAPDKVGQQRKGSITNFASECNSLSDKTDDGDSGGLSQRLVLNLRRDLLQTPNPVVVGRCGLVLGDSSAQLEIGARCHDLPDIVFDGALLRDDGG